MPSEAGTTGRVGIVTVNWNGYDATLRLANNILENDVPDFRLAVVNNSPEEIQNFAQQALFRDPRITIIDSPENVGYSGGLNLGIKNLLSDTGISHFLLLNNDVVFEKDFIQRLLAEGRSPDVIYAPVILYQETGLVQNTGGDIHIWLGGGVNLNKNVPVARIRKAQPDFLSGCILFMHRNVIEKVGLFDEVYGSYCEDVDYCYRTKAQGLSIEILWDIQARHFHSFSTVGNTAYKVYLLNRNQILFAKKHLPPLKREIFIAAAIVRGAVQNLFARQWKTFYRGVVEGLTR